MCTARRFRGSERPMNPLLFADWGRVNRVFTRIMWGVALILVCVVCAVLASAGPTTHTAAARANAGVIADAR